MLSAAHEAGSFYPEEYLAQCGCGIEHTRIAHSNLGEAVAGAM
jgi:hypothetical protein